MATVECFFPLDHPAAQGHFPGDPIVPGAVLLSEALRAIGASLAMSLSPGEIRSAKFFYPVRPGHRVTIEFSEFAQGEIRFTCAVEGKTVLTGVAKCGAIPATE